MSRAALAGSAAPVMARPMTRISAPAAMAAAGRGDPLLVLHCRVGRADAGNDGEEIAAQIVADARRDHAGCRPRRRGRRACARSASDRAWPSVFVAVSKPAAQMSSSERLVRIVTAMSLRLPGHRVGRGLHHVEPARGMDVDDGRPGIEPHQRLHGRRPRYWECRGASGRGRWAAPVSATRAYPAAPWA